jgi:hypothetical protein
MKTDAELVALLLAEARAKRSVAASLGNLNVSGQEWLARRSTRDAASLALAAAVQERLDAETDNPHQCPSRGSAGLLCAVPADYPHTVHVRYDRYGVLVEQWLDAEDGTR